MKRFSVLLVLLGLAVPLAVPAGARAPRGQVALKITSCHHAVPPFERTFGVAARMRALPGTTRMAIRFDLLAHHRGELGYAPVGGKDLGFGVWLKSDPDVGRYRYLRKVRSLDVPGTYRMRVSYRWYGDRATTLLTRRRLTGPCFQPDLRPDLRVRFVRVRVRGPKHDTYVVSVRNAGASAAGPFAISLAFPPASAAVATRWTIPSLGPGEVTQRSLLGGPKCALGAPTATVDPDGAVVESNEANNSRMATCPGP